MRCGRGRNCRECNRHIGAIKPCEIQDRLKRLLANRLPGEAHDKSIGGASINATSKYRMGTLLSGASSRPSLSVRK